MSWSSSWVKYAIQDKHTPEPFELLHIHLAHEEENFRCQFPLGGSSFPQDSTAARQDLGPDPNLPARFTVPFASVWGFSAGPSQHAAVPASPDTQTTARFFALKPTSPSQLSLSYTRNTPPPSHTGPGLPELLKTPFPVSLSHWPVLAILLLQCLVNLFPRFFFFFF